jgi:Kef-type K+ transport system membrane component KefB
VIRTDLEPAADQTFGAGSPFEVVLNYVWAILIFGIFFAAIIVPIVWILSNLKDRWNDLTKRQRIKTIATYAAVVAALALITWRSAMPSNF